MRSPRRGRRPSLRLGAVIFTMVLATTSCTSPQPQPDRSIERTVWLGDAASRLERLVLLDRDTAASLEPSDETPRVYDKSLAIVALGGSAAASVRGADFAISRAKFAQDLMPANKKQLVPPRVPLITEVVRADVAVGGSLLDAGQRRDIRSLVDEILADHTRVQDEWSSYDVMSVVEVSRAVRHRAGDVAAWAARMVDSFEPPLGCASTADLMSLGPALEIGLPVPCGDDALRRLWRMAIDEVSDVMRRKVAAYGNECTLMLPLTQVMRARWPTDRAAAQAHGGLLDASVAALPRHQLHDYPFCLREFRQAADRMGTQLHLPPAAVKYLELFLNGVGGTPRVIRFTLPAGGPAALVHTARLLGTRWPGQAEATAVGGRALDRVALRVETAGPDGPWPAALTADVDKLAVHPGVDPAADLVVMRALAYGGRHFCGSRSIAAARRLLIVPPDTGTPGQLLESRAHAARALRECGAALPDAEQRVLTEATQIMSATGDHGQPIEQVADAVAATCALAPEKLPAVDTLWQRYAPTAATIGQHATGAPEGEEPQLALGSMEAFATVAMDRRQDCVRRGVVG